MVSTLALLLLALLVGLERSGWLALPGAEPAPDAGAPAVETRTGDAGEREARLARLFREERSGVWVEAKGTVEAVLPDDRRGSRHQRLIVRVGPEHTVLVAHNIDLAPRASGVQRGDRVAFRGVYEWNPEGGVVHWTHHDPDGHRRGGFLEHEGRRVR